MINEEAIEDAALFGIEESLDCDLDINESGHIEEENTEYLNEEIAEAVYAHYKGWC